MVQKSPISLSCAALIIGLSTIPAEAQPHHGGGHVTVIQHSPLLWGGGFYGFYGGFYPYYLGFGQSYPYPYAYPPGVYPNDPAVSVRLQVTPREASVFVDGYAAGIVDDYDGVFQRLQARARAARNRHLSSRPSHAAAAASTTTRDRRTRSARRWIRCAPGEPAEPQPVPRASAGDVRNAGASCRAGTLLGSRAPRHARAARAAGRRDRARRRRAVARTAVAGPSRDSARRRDAPCARRESRVFKRSPSTSTCARARRTSFNVSLLAECAGCNG